MSDVSDPARFERLKALFLALRGASAGRRQQLLDEACADDPALRAEAESLLDQDSESIAIPHHPGLAGLLDGTAGAEQAGTATPGSRPGLPEAIGPYRVLGVLGEGGMGLVLRAIQETPIRREVAVKIVRSGLGSPSVIARFESERQTLALMDHPNIARVLDAGSDEQGNPYFVMELVRGEPITRYAATNGLSIRARLELFLCACRAVHDAHTKGIIHRDLKPSNILISSHGGVPEVKIIDFGIAKATEPAPEGAPLTEEGRLIGTLNYMSPEQTTGLPNRVDTRSDIYSLGVILYELLAAAAPYRLKGLPLDEAIRIVTTEMPPHLRVAGSGERLDEDLDEIVRKSMAKDQALRYSSAAELADDLVRYLRSEPILARPPSVTYQLRMLTHRHRAAFLLLTTACSSLAVIAIVTVIELGAQQRERRRAETEALKATKINAFLQEMLASVNPTEKYLDVRVRDVLEDAARRLDFGRMEDPEIEAALRRTLGTTYLALGDYDAASKHLGRALELRTRVMGRRHPLVAECLFDLAELQLAHGADPKGLAVADSLARASLAIRTSAFGEGRAEVAQSLQQLASIHRLRGNNAAAESLHVRSISILRHTAEEGSPELVRNYRSLAEVLVDLNRTAAAESLLLAAVVMVRARSHGDSPELADVLQTYGQFMGNHRESLRVADSLSVAVLAMERRMWGEKHPRVAAALAVLGATRISEGRTAEAESLYEAAFKIRLQFSGDSSTPVAEALNDVGFALWSSGKVEQAEEKYRSAIAIWRAQGIENWHFAMGLNNLGVALADRGRNEESLQIQLEALHMCERVWGPSHTHVGLCNNNIATFLLNRGRYAEAEPYLDKALLIWSECYGETGEKVAVARGNLGYLQHGLDRLAEAEANYRKSVAAHAAGAVGDTWSLTRIFSYTNFGTCLGHEGRFEEAEDVLSRAELEFRKSIGDQHPAYQWVLANLGSVLVERRKFVVAESRLRESLRRLATNPGGAWTAWTQNALAACLAQEGRAAEANSLFRLSGEGAWTRPELLPADRRMAKQRADRFYRPVRN